MLTSDDLEVNCMADGASLLALEPDSACSVLALVFLIVEAGAAGGLGCECTPAVVAPL